MPTSWRSALRSSFGSLTRWPHTTISPLSMVSKRSMQRRAVLLPEPLRPMRTRTSPRLTSKLTPLSTLSAPKLLCTFERPTTDEAVSVLVILCMSGSLKFDASRAAPCFQSVTEARERIAEGEVDDGDDGVDQKGLEQGVVDDLARAREFHEADHRCQRGVLDDLNHEAHGRRRRDPDRLRQDDLHHPLGPAEGEPFGSFPLRLRNGLEAAAPDLAEIGTDEDRERGASGHQGRDSHAERRQAEIGQEHDDEQRRALDELDIAGAENPHGPVRRDAAEGDDEAGDAAAEKADERQADGPERTVSK